MLIRVLLVDNQRLFRQSLSCMLKQDADIRIVGEAADGQEAFSLALEKKPHIVLMDLDLPRMDGVQATRQILERCPKTKVLILSVYDDNPHITLGLEAGASGYVLQGRRLSRAAAHHQALRARRAGQFQLFDRQRRARRQVERRRRGPWRDVDPA